MTNSRIEEIEEFLQRNSAQLKKNYGVKQIGIGFKFEHGKKTDVIAIIFYVNKKEPKVKLEKKGIKVIPKEIDGITTDIIEVPHGFEAR